MIFHGFNTVMSINLKFKVATYSIMSTFQSPWELWISSRRIFQQYSSLKISREKQWEGGNFYHLLCFLLLGQLLLFHASWRCYSYSLSEFCSFLEEDLVQYDPRVFWNWEGLMFSSIQWNANPMGWSIDLFHYSEIFCRFGLCRQAKIYLSRLSEFECLKSQTV